MIQSSRPHENTRSAPRMIGLDPVPYNNNLINVFHSNFVTETNRGYLSKILLIAKSDWSQKSEKYVKESKRLYVRWQSDVNLNTDSWLSRKWKWNKSQFWSIWNSYCWLCLPISFNRSFFCYASSQPGVAAGKLPNLPCKNVLCKWIYERSYIWTTAKR